MTHQWGRTESAGRWPRPKLAWTLGLLLLALLTGAGVVYVQSALTWTPLQRHYVWAYVRSAINRELARPPGTYVLLEIEPQTGPRRIALDPEVQPVSTARGPSFVRSDLAVEMRAKRLVWTRIRARHGLVQNLLRQVIYDGQTVGDLLMPGLRGALTVVFLGLVLAVSKDLARAHERRHGRRLKGPELVTPARFNRRLRSDGIEIALVPRLAARLCGWRSVVRLPRRLESHHLLIMGDTGTGKSALIRQLLVQIEAQGETAIVYDPAGEFLPQFYRPARGDLVLNPLDARCPFWRPGDELRHDSEALTLATALFQDKPGDPPFFMDACRHIFAHLLTFRPSAADLIAWLCDEEALDRRLAGTPCQAMLHTRGSDQRGGVLASLNLVVDALTLLPDDAGTRRPWSARTWAQARRGWLFITSTPATRKPLIPLQSLWLDLLVLRLMTPATAGEPRVWFVLDELASLHKLPQLHTAVTESRKADTPLILGFQGRSQLETRYGHDAEAMLSQPATKIFFRTSEAHAAQWISDTIGAQEIERLAQSRSRGRDRQQSQGLERHVEPLVMPSEISGLAALHGYLKVQNFVVRLEIPYVTLPDEHPTLIERVVPSRTDTPSAPTPAAAGPFFQ